MTSGDSILADGNRKRVCIALWFWKEWMLCGPVSQEKRNARKNSSSGKTENAGR